MDLSISNLPIRVWAEEDRPREKLVNQGAKALSNAELLAIIIGSGSVTESAVELSKRILSSNQQSLHLLSRQNVKQLMQFKGIGEAKAVSIVAALELGRRRKETEVPLQAIIRSSRDAFEQLASTFADLPHEEFWILLTSRSNAVIKTIRISAGGVAGTVVDTKLIFKHALEHLASGLILCHNHPSGNLKPSDADLQLTKRIRESGKLLDIPVLDHLIFGDSAYFSFADEGLL